MSNETIFREVDEELRGDRLRAIWKRFGPFVIGGAIAVILVVAANEGWTWWQNSNAARSSDLFYAALEKAEAGDMEGAQTSLNDVLAQGTGGYPTLARFRQAALLGKDGKADAAIAAYDALSVAETNARLRELALVLAAYHLVDKGNVAAVEQRVAGLVGPESPMRNAAREAIGLTQYKAGDVNGAMATFEQILNDPLAGRDIRGRVQIYVAQLVALGATGPDDAAPAAAAEPGAAAAPSVGEGPELDVVEPATEAAPAETEPVAETPAAETPAN